MVIAWAWRVGRWALRQLRALADDRPRISRARAQALWCRQEMDRHPVERVEAQVAEDEATPVRPGEPVRPGDVRKAPVFPPGE